MFLAGASFGGAFAPLVILKIVIFVFLHAKFCFFRILPLPRKSVKILPPPLEKT